MKLRTLLLLFFLCTSASAQTTLQPGTPVERELQRGQVHTFTIDLEENRFVQLVVEQRGIDVVVKVFPPSATTSLGVFDTPNGPEGPEHVSFVAVTAGSYRVEVGPLDPRENASGRYEIKILEVRQATDQELKASQNVEVTKAKGIALLADIEALIPQIKSPQTRIRAQMQAAQLLWDIDQKRASKLFADATTTFREFLASLDADDFQFSGGTVVQLRHEMIYALAARDPDAALNFLHSTSQLIAAAYEQRQHSSTESALELSIADQIVSKNPKRALQMAKQTLKQGYSPQLMSTLSQLRRQDPELGAELANEIAAKLVTENLLKLPEAGYAAANLLRFLPSTEFAAQPTNGTPAPHLLTEDRVRELVQKIFDDVMSYSPPTRQTYDSKRDSIWNMLNALKSFPQLDTIVSGGNAAVEKKLAGFNDSASRFGGAYAFAGNAGEMSIEAIEKLPAEMRDHYYTQFAFNKAQKNDVAGARQIINERISEPAMRRNALSQLGQIEMQMALNTGKIDDLLKTLSKVRNPRERAQQLAQITNQLGPGLKRTTALNLLEQVRTLLSPSVQAEDQDQMMALLEISRAFSRYDIKRSFEIIDPLIEQFNELCAAARKLDGFGNKYYEGEELELESSNPLAVVTSQLSTVLGSLAVINFDRAKATTERIGPPEVRLRIYLEIAQQTTKAGK